MAKLDKLTPEQEAQLPLIRDEWLGYGLNTDPTDWERAEAAILNVYAAASLSCPPKMYRAGSPASGALLAAYLEANKRIRLKDGVFMTTRSSDSALMESAKSHTLNAIYGQHDAASLSFYDALRRFGVDGLEPLNGLMELAKCCGWCFPYDECCILTDRPMEVHLNETGELHRDGGMAIRYRDTWGVWCLSGVRVPRWLAETARDKIDPRKFAKITNVEIRREFVRKVGMERIVDTCKSSVLDEVGDYELLDIDLGGETGRWPYLKMKNPSIGVWHLEAVSKGCTTVQEAINFRSSRLKNLKGDWKPEILT